MIAYKIFYGVKITMITDSDRSRLQTGFKQATRAVNLGKVQKLIIALDSDDKVREPLVSAAEEKGIEIVTVPTMEELGRLCEIEVGASCAVILK